MIEKSDRVTATYDHLVSCGLVARCIQLAERAATDEELLLVHKKEHILQIALRAAAEPFFNKNVYFSPAADAAARLACGGVIDATLAVLSGKIAGRAFALVRPPGHHASREGVSSREAEPCFAEGGCFYNSVAAAAAAALAQGVARVAVVDWDVHHGNGTQEIFYDDERVLYISLHASTPKEYPDTGEHDEVGEGGGVGFNVNIMWPNAKSCPPCDADYAAAFDLVVLPILRAYKPDLLLISAGFDAAHDEQFHVQLTPAGFAQMTRVLLNALPKVAVVAALEGGYNPPSVAACGEAVLRVLLGDDVDAPTPLKFTRNCKPTLLRVAKVQQTHWPAAVSVKAVEAYFKARKAEQALLQTNRGSKRGR